MGDHQRDTKVTRAVTKAQAAEVNVSTLNRGKLSYQMTC